MGLDKAILRITGKPDSIRTATEVVAEAVDSSTIVSDKEPMTTCSDAGSSQTGFQAVKEIKNEEELARPLSSSELKSFCNEFNISFSALRKNLSKMSHEECTEFRRSIRLSPYEVTKGNFKALITDEDIVDLAKIFYVSEDKFKLFLSKVEESDMHSVVQAIREVQNISDATIEKMILEAFNKEISRISIAVKIPEQILKECIKPDIDHKNFGPLGVFNPIDYSIKFSTKTIRYSLLNDLYYKYNGDTSHSPGPVNFKNGIGGIVADVVPHECKHLEQALRLFLNFPKSDAVDVLIEISLQEIKTGNPRVISSGPQSEKLVEVPNLSEEIRGELVTLIEKIYRNPDNHGITDDDLFRIGQESLNEIIKLNPTRIKETITVNGWERFGFDDELNIRSAANKIYEDYQYALMNRPDFCKQIIEFPYRSEKLASLRQFVNPKPTDREMLIKEVKGLIETIDANLRGGFLGIMTRDEYLAYLNSPNEVEARMNSVHVRVSSLHSATEEIIKNPTPRSLINLNRSLQFIESELSREAISFKNPQKVELKQQLHEINEMLKGIKSKLTA